MTANFDTLTTQEQLASGLQLRLPEPSASSLLVPGSKLHVQWDFRGYLGSEVDRRAVTLSECHLGFFLHDLVCVKFNFVLCHSCPLVWFDAITDKNSGNGSKQKPRKTEHFRSGEGANASAAPSVVTADFAFPLFRQWSLGPSVPCACRARRHAALLTVAGDVRCVQIPESATPTSAAGVRVLHFPGAAAAKLAIVGETELPMADVTVAIGSIENLRELVVCIGHLKPVPFSSAKGPNKRSKPLSRPLQSGPQRYDPRRPLVM
jgi:hypothetical protein